MQNLVRRMAPSRTLPRFAGEGGPNACDCTFLALPRAIVIRGVQASLSREAGEGTGGGAGGERHVAR
jgi:hypothetical protein